jgi:hypothetical protein
VGDNVSSLFRVPAPAMETPIDWTIFHVGGGGLGKPNYRYQGRQYNTATTVWTCRIPSTFYSIPAYGF